MITVSRMRETTWAKKFKPVPNHLNSNASWSWGENGCLYETYGEEEQYIYSLDFHKVWTLVDIDGVDYIISGRAYVNRIGYFVTEESWLDTNEIEVKVSNHL